MRTCCVLGALLAFLSPRPLHAASDPLQTQGRFRLGLEAAALAFETTSAEADGVDADASVLDVGLPGNELDLVLGGGVEWLVLNAHLGYATSAQEAFGAELTSTRFSLRPEVELLLSRSGVLFYVAPTVGFAIENTEATQDGLEIEITETSALFGAAGGLHAFVADRVSLDAALTLIGFTGELDVGGVRGDSSGFGAVLSFGLSGWLGGDPPPPKRQPASAEPEKPSRPTPEPPAPAAAPAPAVVVDPTRRVSARFSLPTGEWLHFTGTPADDGETTALRVMLTRIDSPDCNAADLVIGDVRVPVEGARLVQSGLSRPELYGSIAVSGLLVAAKAAGAVSLEACGVALPLDADHRKKLAAFVDQFRRIAERQGTWRLRPVPTAPSPAEPSPATPDAEAPPGEAPGTGAAGQAPPAQP